MDSIKELDRICKRILHAYLTWLYEAMSSLLLWTMVFATLKHCHILFLIDQSIIEDSLVSSECTKKVQREST